MHFLKPRSIFLQLFIITAVMLPATVFAQAPADVKVMSVTAATQAPAVSSTQEVSATQQSVTVQPVNCTFASVGNPEFKAKFLAVKKPGIVQPGELFTMQIYVQNEGNLPWFSEDSGCNTMTVVRLGTEKKRDRVSPFFTNEKNPVTGAANTWRNGARIKMDNKRVSPLQAATFTITAKAPEEPGVYREFYAPVAEGITWMEGEGLFSVDINVGGASIDESMADYLTYVQKSANLSKLKLEGGKNITIDLSEQRMYVNIGETTIRTFPVSTGTSRTPTPRGSYKILSKQEVRVASKRPHYIMPKFMMFKAGGYGIHALPSLANDRGVFWREALNHIGSPRSHGCVRLLPGDAEFMFGFADVGTPVNIRW